LYRKKTKKGISGGGAIVRNSAGSQAYPVGTHFRILLFTLCQVDEAFDLHAFLQWRDPFGRRLPRGVQLDAHTRETLLTVSGG
jgi:hypothetical protein